MYCGRCKSPIILYCSRECQKKDYKVHKKTCTLNNKIFAFAGEPIDKTVPKQQPGLPGRNLEVTIKSPFTSSARRNGSTIDQ